MNSHRYFTASKIAEWIALVVLPLTLAGWLIWTTSYCPHRECRETLVLKLSAYQLEPHQRSPEDRAELLPRLERLSYRLCQTQACILDALAQSGLTVVPLPEAPK